MHMFQIVLDLANIFNVLWFCTGVYILRKKVLFTRVEDLHSRIHPAIPVVIAGANVIALAIHVIGSVR